MIISKDRQLRILPIAVRYAPIMGHFS